MYMYVGDPPNVPPRKRTLSQHHHTKQTSNTYQPVVPKLQSLATVDLGKHQELRAFPPTLKPKPAGYRIYDALDENEAQVRILYPLYYPQLGPIDQRPLLTVLYIITTQRGDYPMCVLHNQEWIRNCPIERRVYFTTTLLPGQVQVRALHARAPAFHIQLRLSRAKFQSSLKSAVFEISVMTS